MTLKLIELEPHFLTIESEDTFQMHDDISKADGIEFLCPVCFAKNGGRVGTHAIICWQPHVLPTCSPGPGRWTLQGTGYNDLTLGPAQPGGASSVLLTTAECKAHFRVLKGEIK